MTIIGVAGAIGSGKSFTQLLLGIQYAEQRRKQIVTNFALNLEHLKRYCLQPQVLEHPFGSLYIGVCHLWFALRYIFYQALPRWFPPPRFPRFKPRYPWVAHMCDHGGIIQIPGPKTLESLLIPESVVLLDEAGILLNSRDFAHTSKKLLADLAQSRKDGTDLIWCAQFDEQVDKQMRLLTQFWIYCSSLSVYDKRLRRPSLKWKMIWWFTAADFQAWFHDPKIRGSYFKTRFAYVAKAIEGPLTKTDQMLFTIYDSFARLDQEIQFGERQVGTTIHTLFKCHLPHHYYFERLPHYHEVDDPFSCHYQPTFGWYRKPPPLAPSFTSTVELTAASMTESIVERTPVLLPSNKTQLIKLILSRARSQGLKPPFLKSMTVPQLKQYAQQII